jgi:hypothetical protein
VDCVVLTPEGKVTSVRAVHDLMTGPPFAENYQRFLHNSLEAPVP